MGKFVDLTGKKFGMLTVIKRAENTKDNKAMWYCLCDCGNHTIARANDITRGRKTSCGCKIRSKIVSKENSWSRLYNTWHHMKDRCFRKKSKSYKDYGERGITVCDEWLKFEPFRDWALANGYRDDLTIDRIDVNGNYEPSNCRWITKSEQAGNRRDTITLTYKGRTQTLKQWSEETGIGRLSLVSRLNRGWTTEKIITTPITKKRGK